MQPLSGLTISVETFEGSYMDDSMAYLNYDVICTIDNITSGSKTVVIHEQARGDGSGMDLNIS